MTPVRRHLNGAGASLLIHGAMAGSILWAWQHQPVKPPPEPVTWEISLYSPPAPPAPVAEPLPVPQPVAAPPPPKPVPPKPRPKPKPKVVERPVPKPVTRYLARETPRESPEPPAPALEPAPPAPVPRPGPVARAAPAAAEKPDQPDFGWLRGYLGDKIRKNRRYPGEAKENGWEGKVLVRAVIGSTGDLLSAEIVRSSGHQVLDQEAVATLRRSMPVPVSEAHHWTRVAITIPFDYRLER